MTDYDKLFLFSHWSKASCSTFLSTGFNKRFHALLSAELAERLGFVNHVVEEGQLSSKGREVAEAIIRNNRDLVSEKDGLQLEKVPIFSGLLVVALDFPMLYGLKD